eukprot:5408678-Pyramimonas_sp.AAC.1
MGAETSRHSLRQAGPRGIHPALDKKEKHYSESRPDCTDSQNKGAPASTGETGGRLRMTYVVSRIANWHAPIAIPTPTQRIHNKGLHSGNQNWASVEVIWTRSGPADCTPMNCMSTNTPSHELKYIGVEACSENRMAT